MGPASIRLGVLLSPQATILHVTRRRYFEKRIVECSGIRFVLYRFPSLRLLDRFYVAYQKAVSANVTLQSLAIDQAACSEKLDGGYWVALVFENGCELEPMSPMTVMDSLGENLARLHSIRSDRRYALFSGDRPKIPYKEFIRYNNFLQKDVFGWVASSEKRIGKTKVFSLVHGDPLRKNFIVTPDQRIVLIDYELFGYDIPGVELGRVLLNGYCRGEEGRQVLLSSYLDACPGDIRLAWEENKDDYYFAAAVSIWWGRIRRLRLLKIQNISIKFKMLLNINLDMRFILERRLENNFMNQDLVSRQINIYATAACSIAENALGKSSFIEP